MEPARRTVVFENIALRNYILMSVETSDSLEAARYFLNMDESVCAALFGSVRIV